MANDDQDQLTLWLERLSAGNEQAAQIIWQAYFEKLVLFAKRRMGSLPKRIADEEDLALSAMQSFCQGLQAGRYPNLASRDDLWKLIVTITARKTYRLINRQTSLKRGGGQIRGESIFEGNNGDDERMGIAGILGTEPTPDLAVMFAENCEQLLERLADPLLRQIAVLKLEGHSNDEIAELCQCATRTIERKLERIRKIWEPMSQADLA